MTASLAITNYSKGKPIVAHQFDLNRDVIAGTRRVMKGVFHLGSNPLTLGGTNRPSHASVLTATGWNGSACLPPTRTFAPVDRY